MEYLNAELVEICTGYCRSKHVYQIAFGIFVLREDDHPLVRPVRIAFALFTWQMDRGTHVLLHPLDQIANAASG